MRDADLPPPEATPPTEAEAVAMILRRVGPRLDALGRTLGWTEAVYGALLLALLLLAPTPRGPFLRVETPAWAMGLFHALLVVLPPLPLVAWRWLAGRHRELDAPSALEEPWLGLATALRRRPEPLRRAIAYARAALIASAIGMLPGALGLAAGLAGWRMGGTLAAPNSPLFMAAGLLAVGALTKYLVLPRAWRLRRFLESPPVPPASD